MTNTTFPTTLETRTSIPRPRFNDDSLAELQSWVEWVTDELIAHGAKIGADASAVAASLDARAAALEASSQVGGYIPLDIGTIRAVVSDALLDETVVSTGGSEKASGGILAVDGAIGSYARVNGATDKAARVVLKNGTTGEFQFAPAGLPPDLDSGQNVTIHLLAEMAGATDTPTIDVQAFAGKGDTEMGGATAALSNAIAELTVTLTAANIPALPTFLNIILVPGAHTTDAIWIYAAWIEYTRITA